ncbi:MAG: hypothetical protein ACRCT8_00435 [Lacipirellulaceae bacterium]
MPYYHLDAAAALQTGMQLNLQPIAPEIAEFSTNVLNWQEWAKALPEGFSNWGLSIFLHTTPVRRAESLRARATGGSTSQVIHLGCRACSP